MIRNPWGVAATVHFQDPPVSDTRGYEIVKVVEKHGAFHSAIPVMPMGFAVVFCLINMFLPGIGKLNCEIKIFSW